MHKRRSTGKRRSTAVGIIAAAMLALSGCSILGGSGPEPTTDGPTTQDQDGPTPADVELLPEGTTTVDLAPGESIQVSLGTGNQGIGDDWGVVANSAETVATAEVVRGDDVAVEGAESDAPGSETPFAVAVDAHTPGTTTVRVLYCTRTKVAEGCDQSKGTKDAPVGPIELTITVAE